MEKLLWIEAIKILSLTAITSIIVYVVVKWREIFKRRKILNKITKMTNIQFQEFLLAEFKCLRADFKDELNSVKLDIKEIKNEIMTLKLSNVKMSTKLGLFIVFISGLTSTLIYIIPKIFV